MNALIKYYGSREGWRLTRISGFNGRFSVSGYMLCCGVREISGLHYYRSMEEAMYALMFQLSNSKMRRRRREGFDYYNYPIPRKLEKTKCAHMIFTQAGNSRYGFRFAQFIRDNKLGKVTTGPGAINPNSQNRVVAFIWTLDQQAVLKWWNGKVDEFENYLIERRKEQRKDAAQRRHEAPPAPAPPQPEPERMVIVGPPIEIPLVYAPIVQEQLNA